MQEPDREAQVRALREDLTVEVDVRAVQLRLASTWGLFSPRAVDAGTRLLLQHVEVGESDDCCDLGCGYGVIGLVLASLAPGGRTTLLDKDFVAVEYARRNAERNRIGNARALLSNGFDGLDDDTFDVIATNLPAKSGKELYRIMFHDAAARLAPGGRFYVVSLSALRHFVARELGAVLGNCRKLKTSGQYTLALAVRN